MSGFQSHGSWLISSLIKAALTPLVRCTAWTSCQIEVPARGLSLPAMSAGFRLRVGAIF